MKDEIRGAFENCGIDIEKITMVPSENSQRRFGVISLDAGETGCQVIVDKFNGKAWKEQRLEAEQ
jgi:hypothetical protein